MVTFRRTLFSLDYFAEGTTEDYIENNWDNQSCNHSLNQDGDSFVLFHCKDIESNVE